MIRTCWLHIPNKFSMTEFSNIKKTRPILKITIVGNTVRLFLIGGRKKIIAESKWKDNRDLSEKLLEKVDFLLRKKRLSLGSISKVDFFCDSPYFTAGNKAASREQKFLFPASGLSSFLYENSKNKCGFTSWQTGEIAAKVLNFIIKTN